MTKPLVILVNEDKGQVEQLSMFLQDNHDVLVFNTPEEILDVFSAYCLRVRAVLISVQLTQVKAMDLLKKLKKISVLPEYIMVSTKANITEAVDALTYGAVDYISWPSDKHLLLKK